MLKYHFPSNVIMMCIVTNLTYSTHFCKHICCKFDLFYTCAKYAYAIGCVNPSFLQCTHDAMMSCSQVWMGSS